MSIQINISQGFYNNPAGVPSAPKNVELFNPLFGRHTRPYLDITLIQPATNIEGLKAINSLPDLFSLYNIPKNTSGFFNFNGIEFLALQGTSPAPSLYINTAKYSYKGLLNYLAGGGKLLIKEILFSTSGSLNIQNAAANFTLRNFYPDGSIKEQSNIIDFTKAPDTVTNIIEVKKLDILISKFTGLYFDLTAANLKINLTLDFV